MPVKIKVVGTQPERIAVRIQPPVWREFVSY
jgi:hypothetical protein